MPGTEQTIRIPRRGAKELTFSGKAETLGAYFSEAIVDPPASGSTDPLTIPITIRIARLLPNLGENPIAIEAPGRRTWSTSKDKIWLSIRNASDEEVTLAAPPAARLLRDEGNQNYIRSAKALTVNCGEPMVLPARGELECTVASPSLLGAGRYLAQVRVANSVAPATAQSDFTVRTPWWIAALIVLIGGILGALLAGYQSSGRRRALQAVDMRDLREKLDVIAKSLTADNADARAIIEDVQRRLAAALEDLRTKAEADHANDLTNWGRRLPLLHRFAALEAAYRNEPASTDLDAAYAAAKAAVEQAIPPDDAGAILDQLKSRLGRTRANLRVAGNEAQDPAEYFFTWRAAATSADLLGMVRRLDLAILALSILIATAIAVATLWAPNPTWGGLGDLLVAFFTGLGLTLTGALSLRQLVGSYTLGTIGGK